mmetsp:Transcript_28498/g.49215  ORF Transcript_28498/g.49215 Transcript_28498/m.49215 type:complete len:85 (+) Transcript_28498:426-680(+)
MEGPREDHGRTVLLPSTLSPWRATPIYYSPPLLQLFYPLLPNSIPLAISSPCIAAQSSLLVSNFVLFNAYSYSPPPLPTSSTLS